MDAKSRQIVALLRDRVESGNYDEIDVLALFASVRESAPKKSAVRELGDFLVHREKDRGVVRTYVDHIAEFIEAQKAKEGFRFKVAPIHTVDEVFRNLRDILKGLGLAPLSKKQAADCLACIMVILQGVCVAENGEELGKLQLAVGRDELWLACNVPYSRKPAAEIDLSCPALIVPNRYCEGPPKANEMVPLEGLAGFGCRNGEARIFVVGGES